MGFCEWPVTIPPGLTAEWSALPQSTRDRAQLLAGRVLWTLTGQVFGLCEATVRPCWQPDDAVRTYGVGISNAAPCGCGTDCRHVASDRVPLPGPVHGVTGVTVDGVAVNASAYRVQQRRWLRRTDGKAWPMNQDLTVADNAVGAFVVGYVKGIPVPADGSEMAGLLAVELARGMTGGACALPTGVTSVARQGISVELADMREWFTNGLTGVEQVDLWIMGVNPFKSKSPARIISPDRPHTGRFA